MRFPTLVHGGIRRPIVSVCVEAAPGNHIATDALVDMGADVTLLPQSVARDLGIDLTGAAEYRVTSPLGPGSKYRASVVVLELRRPHEVFRWRTTVGFVPRAMAYGILGTRGFFEFFNVRYHASEHWLDIDPAGPLPLCPIVACQFRREQIQQLPRNLFPIHFLERQREVRQRGRAEAGARAVQAVGVGEVAAAGGREGVQQHGLAVVVVLARGGEGGLDECD
jgi:hypothetical protein